MGELLKQDVDGLGKVGIMNQPKRAHGSLLPALILVWGAAILCLHCLTAVRQPPGAWAAESRQGDRAMSLLLDFPF